jgi:hypothetical protein
MFNGDFFVGGALNSVDGSMTDFQSFFYETGTDRFPNEVRFSGFNTFTAGAHFRVVPLNKMNNILSWISVSVGALYIRKGYNSEFNLLNKNLAYEDRTTISEEFRSHNLSLPVMLRYGNRVYLEGGFAMDFLLNGDYKYNLTRKTSGVNAYEGAFETGKSSEMKLDDSTLSGFSTAWCFAAGYNFYRPFGVRFYGTINNKFFREGPNLTNSQYSLQLTYTLN